MRELAYRRDVCIALEVLMMVVSAIFFQPQYFCRANAAYVIKAVIERDERDGSGGGKS